MGDACQTCSGDGCQPTTTARSPVIDEVEEVPVLLVSFYGNYSALDEQQVAAFESQVLSAAVARYDVNLVATDTAEIELVRSSSGSVHVRIMFPSAGGLNADAVSAISASIEATPLVAAVSSMTYVSRNVIVTFEAHGNVTRTTVSPDIDGELDLSASSSDDSGTTITAEAVFAVFGCLLVIVVMCAVYEFRRQNTSLSKNTKLIGKLAQLDDMALDEMTSPSAHNVGHMGEFEEEHWLRMGGRSPLQPGQQWRPHQTGSVAESVTARSYDPSYHGSPFPAGFSPFAGYSAGFGATSPGSYHSAMNSRLESPGSPRPKLDTSVNGDPQMYLPGSRIPGEGSPFADFTNKVYTDDDMFEPKVAGGSRNFAPGNAAKTAFVKDRAARQLTGRTSKSNIRNMVSVESGSSFDNLDQMGEDYLPWLSAAREEVQAQAQFERAPRWDQLMNKQDSLNLDMFEMPGATEDTNDEDKYDHASRLKVLRTAASSGGASSVLYQKATGNTFKLEGDCPDSVEVSCDPAIRQPLKGDHAAEEIDEADYDFAHRGPASEIANSDHTYAFSDRDTMDVQDI